MNDSTVITEAEPRQDVQVTFPDGRTFSGPVGTTAETFINTAYPNPKVPFILAMVDKSLRELTYPVRRDCTLEPIDLSQSDGIRVYHRALTFLMVAAAQRIFPGVEIYVDHSLPFGGYFCEVRKRDPFTEDELKTLCAEMRRMVDADYPIVRENVPVEEALNTYHEHGEWDKVALFNHRDRKKKNYLQLYNLNGYRDYFHGYMVPSTGYLKYFQLLSWGNGFILQFPRRHQPTTLQPPSRDPKLIRVFREYGQWLRLLHVENVAELNEMIATDRLRQIILVSEALHEHRIADIAHQIWERRDQIRLVLIAGPSSSGKTTFSKRLAVQLLAHGIRPYALELDNYFVNRELTPRDEHGNYDFESLGALDVPLFNQHLKSLMNGEVTHLPKFNFYTGQREEGETVQLSRDQVMIAEGIHGLNPKLVPEVDPESTFRIYVSALTQLNLDRHNRVPTTDTRLCRRIVRDARTRGYSAQETLGRWNSVRKGEKEHIFPYQENADVMFNSALVYELAVLKPFVEPLLRQVEPDSRQWVEAKRLLSFLQWFLPADLAHVPENSLLREFVGGLSLETFHWE